MSNLLHALLMAAFAWLFKTGAPMWSKWSMGLGAPLVAGFINGLILGDLPYGLQMGGTIMLVYIGITAIGGVVASDVTLGGYIGVTVAMMAHTAPDVGITVAATLGLLGSLISPVEKTLNTIWVSRAHKAAETGNTKPLFALSCLAPMIWSFLIYGIPAFIIIYFGADVLDTFLATVPAQITTALATVGNLLPCLGLAMLMNLLFKSTMIPFFILGFCASAYLGLGTTPIAIIGVAFAFMHYLYSNKEVA